MFVCVGCLDCCAGIHGGQPWVFPQSSVWASYFGPQCLMGVGMRVMVAILDTGWDASLPVCLLPYVDTGSDVTRHIVVVS